MILWEKSSLDDREAIFEFLYEFNQQPLMGVEREGIPGRLLIIPEVSMIVSYFIKDDIIHILRVLHQKQKFPVGN